MIKKMEPEQKEEKILPEDILEEKDFKFYFNIIKWPLLVVVLWALFSVFTPLAWGSLWVIKLVAFIYVGWVIFKKRQGSLPQSLITGLVLGALTGFLLALINFIWHPRVWKFFALITDPVTDGLIGAGAVGLTFFVLQKKIQDIFKEKIFKSKKK